MLRYAKFLGAACGLLLSLTAQASTYTFVGGTTFDLYYDTAVLGNNVTLSGNNLTLNFSDSTNNFQFNANTSGSPLVIVPHAGYELSHYVPVETSATATLGGPASWQANGYSALYGGTFAGGAFNPLSFVAETSSSGYRQLFLGDEPRSESLNSLYDIQYYDMEPDASHAAYAVNFEAFANASWDGAQDVVLHSPTVSIGFSLTDAPIAPVPEPGSWLMLAAGLALLAVKAKRSAT
jgi:hypothetical protein